MTVKAIIFDLFETLVTEFDEKGRIAPASSFSPYRLGLSDDDFNRAWVERKKKRMEGGFQDYTAILEDILQSYGKNVSREILEKYNKERIIAKSYPFKKISSSIIDTLQTIKSNQIKLGLISNCGLEEVIYWKNCGIDHLFDVSLFSYEVGLAKPDTRIYQLACGKLDVNPSNVIYIGDGDRLLYYSPFRCCRFFFPLASPKEMAGILNNSVMQTDVKLLVSYHVSCKIRCRKTRTYIY
ncbi:(S)-2-haloacid dehalogenase 4A [compost metagenome]